MQVVVQDLMTSYEKFGAGKTVLIVHGWGDSQKSWIPFAQKLARNFEVITVDLPGFGNTAAPRNNWGLTDYANFIKDFLEKIHKPNIYALVGHSNGGAIVIRGLANHLLYSDRAILFASAGIRNEYNGRKKILRIMTKTGKLFTYPLPVSIKHKIRKAVYTKIGSDMLVAERMQETFKKVVTDDVREDAEKIDIPTLLVYGENDTATPVLYGEIFQQLIPSSTLEVIGNVGHFLYLDAFQKIVKAAEEFLK